MAKPKKQGVCALTGKHGNFAKAHIIPKSLTKPSEAGAPLLEGTKGQGFARRWSSWYDPELVTHEGEKILSDLDDAGIKELRRHQFIWSSWKVFKPHFAPIGLAIPDYSIRTVKVSNAAALGKFLLSVVWRAAASKMYSMKDVTASPSDLEKLRRIVVGDADFTPSEFPISIVQLSTIGETHNLTPYNYLKHLPGYAKEPEKTFPIVRLYMDGAIFHVHWSKEGLEDLHDSTVFLGFADRLDVVGVTYEASFQYENLTVNAFESVFGSISSPKW